MCSPLTSLKLIRCYHRILFSPTLSLSFQRPRGSNFQLFPIYLDADSSICISFSSSRRPSCPSNIDMLLLQSTIGVIVTQQNLQKPHYQAKEKKKQTVRGYLICIWQLKNSTKLSRKSIKNVLSNISIEVEKVLRQYGITFGRISNKYSNSNTIGTFYIKKLFARWKTTTPQHTWQDEYERTGSVRMWPSSWQLVTTKNVQLQFYWFHKLRLLRVTCCCCDDDEDDEDDVVNVDDNVLMMMLLLKCHSRQRNVFLLIK